MKRLFTSFFILLTASGLWAQTIYSGSSFTIGAKVVSTTDLTITDQGTITDLNITISASHNDYMGIVDFKLISPYGTIVDLVTSGCSGPVFSETTFDDEGDTAIASGTPPYYGSFLPEGSLSDFDQEEMNEQLFPRPVMHKQCKGSESNDEKEFSTDWIDRGSHAAGGNRLQGQGAGRKAGN